MHHATTVFRLLEKQVVNGNLFHGVRVGKYPIKPLLSIVVELVTLSCTPLAAKLRTRPIRQRMVMFRIAGFMCTFRRRSIDATIDQILIVVVIRLRLLFATTVSIFGKNDLLSLLIFAVATITRD